MWPHQPVNLAEAAGSVLFSDPDGGVFETGRAWGDVPPRLYVAIVGSVMTTGLIARVVAARLRGRARQIRDDRDQFLVVFAAVLIANSAFFYAYTKHEILTAAGAFYALAAFAAGRHFLEYLSEPARGAARIALVLVLAATAAVWAFRSAGVHHMLRVQGFKVRNDWARVPPEMLRNTGTPEAALIRQLRHDALEMHVANPYLLPRWADRWWGE